MYIPPINLLVRYRLAFVYRAVRSLLFFVEERPGISWRAVIAP
jgi:hypothetical protein